MNNSKSIDDVQEIALRLLSLGYSPLRVERGSKAATSPGWQIHTPTEESVARAFARPSNLGVRCGDMHKDSTCLVAIDLDVDDFNLISCIDNAIGCVVPVKKGKKGCTWFVRLDSAVKTHKIYQQRDGKKEAVIDILGLSAQTVIPPSTHPDTKEPYQWIAGKPLWEVDYRELPVFGLELIDEIEGFCKNGHDDPIVQLNTMEWKGVGGGGNTHDICVRAVAAMVSRKWPDSAIHERIQRAKRTACEVAGKPYNWPEAQKIIQGWIDSAREKFPEKKVVKTRLSHGDIAVNVLFKHAKIIKWDKKRAWWYVYNGKFWEENAQGDLKTLIRKSLTDEQTYKSVIDGTEAVMRLYPEITVSHNIWNPDKHYINCPTGTINLNTAELLPHNPEHFITRMTKVSPRYDYEDTRWVNELPTWFGDNPEDLEYVQTLLGMFLTGEIKDHCVAMWLGVGGSGKSRAPEIMLHILGDYAQVATDTAFLDSKFRQHSEEIARMNGKRLVIINEVEGNLNLQRVKAMSAGESVSASFKGQDSFEFSSEAKLWFIGNEPPPSKSSGTELRRRYHVFDFVKAIKKRDGNMRDILESEAEYILGWAIHGAVKYYRNGLHPSPHVKASTDRYFTNADILSQWVEERCIVDTSARLSAAAAYFDFDSWSDGAGIKFRPDRSRFTSRLKAMGYDSKTAVITRGKSPERAIIGLRLRNEGETLHIVNAPNSMRDF